MTRTATLSLLLIVALGTGAGCVNTTYVTPERLQHGLVIILPGIEGESPFNHDIRSGLLNAGVQQAVAIYNWGRPIPLAGPLLNQMDVIGNRLAASSLAGTISQYQDTHPGAPVYLVGHSGGGGIAVFVAEAMPPNHDIDGLVLLSASISSGYDLSNALRHCREGVANFYNPGDAVLLGVGTTLLGNVDGVRGASAGLSGFDHSWPRLYQVPIGGNIAEAHIAATQAGYVAQNVARWVQTRNWPPDGKQTAAASRDLSAARTQG